MRGVSCAGSELRAVDGCALVAGMSTCVPVVLELVTVWCLRVDVCGRGGMVSTCRRPWCLSVPSTGVRCPSSWRRVVSAVPTDLDRARAVCLPVCSSLCAHLMRVRIDVTYRRVFDCAHQPGTPHRTPHLGRHHMFTFRAYRIGRMFAPYAGAGFERAARIRASRHMIGGTR